MEKYINKITDPQLKSMARHCYKELEDNFDMPSSTSGKYHPVDELESGGLKKHTIRVIEASVLLNSIERNINNDIIIIAAMFHDSFRKEQGRLHHAIMAYNYFLSMKSHFPNLKPQIDDIARMILWHEGEWTPDYAMDLSPKPSDNIIHVADYLVSRRDFAKLMQEN